MAGKIKNFIIVILVISLIAPGAFLVKPERATAAGIPVVDWINWIINGINTGSTQVNTGTNLVKTTYTLKEWAWHIITELAKAAAMKALQDMTKSTVTWINSGYHGSPLFLENPQSFFQDIAKWEVRTLVDRYGYDSLKFPFGRDFALSTIGAYRSRLEENRAYSLSNYITDPVALSNYQNDFNVGGWDGFFLNTQLPQNNPMGFQLEATDELARKIQGTSQTAKDKVQATLNQGMGFLSPQICQTNTSYNDMKNEFNAPKFNMAEYEKKYMENMPYCANDNACTEEELATIKQYREDYTLGLAAARQEWATTNECPPRKDGSSGLVNTTPGSVVANQIIKSVETPTNLKQMAINSGSIILSAVFDRLINKFITKGLNSLASTANPDQPEGDEWSYNGLTLGGSATVNGYNDDPWATPDEVVTVSDFKTTLENDIEQTEAEIKYMTNDVPDSFGPGTMQALAQIWPKVQTLDACQPGPDIKWKERMDSETYANQAKFEIESLEERNELTYAVGVFKDWVDLQLRNALPSSASFINAIRDLDNLNLQAPQVEDRIDAKMSVLVQLKSLKAQLDVITGEPSPGSENEKKLFSLWTQYKSMGGQISSDLTLGEARSERGTALAKRENLDQLLIQCKEERVAKGWAVEGGAQSKLAAGGATEQNYFCDGPIIGGYSHKMFVNPAATPAYPQIPLVNAQNIQVGTSSVDITMSCSAIFNANILDYKGDLPSF